MQTPDAQIVDPVATTATPAAHFSWRQAALLFGLWVLIPTIGVLGIPALLGDSELPTVGRVSNFVSSPLFVPILVGLLQAIPLLIALPWAWRNWLAWPLLTGLGFVLGALLAFPFALYLFAMGYGGRDLGGWGYVWLIATVVLFFGTFGFLQCLAFRGLSLRLWLATAGVWSMATIVGGALSLLAVIVADTVVRTHCTPSLSTFQCAQLKAATVPIAVTWTYSLVTGLTLVWLLRDQLTTPRLGERGN
jgi:hypothetical protein